MTTFIYGLFDPRNYSLRYIGKSDNPNLRLKQHIKEARHSKKRNRYVASWIRQLLSEDLQPDMEVLEECTQDNWQESEKAWIAECRKFGVRLTNTTDGGDGVNNPPPEVRARMASMRGKTHSDEWRQYMSSLFKGRVSPNKGNTHSEEVRKRISESQKGKKLSEEQVKALSERNQWRGKEGWNKGKKFTQGHKDKISASHLGEKNPMYGKSHSEESKQNLSKKNKGQKRPEEFGKASSERQKGKKFTEQHKQSLKLAQERRRARERGE